MKEPLLQIKISNKKPIELFDLATSMSSISSEYHRFLRQTKRERANSQSKLFVQRISEGSIIIELCELAPQILPGIAPTLIEYSKFIVDTLNYLTGRNAKLPASYRYQKEDFENIKKLLEVAVNFHGNTLNFTGINFGTVHNYTYTSVEANAGQNQCDKELKSLEKSGDGLIRENVELNLYQARDSKLSASTLGNLGVIEEICPKPKRLSFANDKIRYAITKGETNPFNFTFVVDVEVKLKEGSMFLEDQADIGQYEILNLHGPVEKRELFSTTTHKKLKKPKPKKPRK